jgi:hypothetical protein
MKSFDVKISVINPDYDAEYEKEYGFLERQYENSKFDSEICWKIIDVTEYRYRENVSFVLEYLVNGTNHKYSLNNVCVLELLKNDKIITEVIVSKSLISSTRAINKKNYSKGYFYFYLKPKIYFERLSDLIYVTAIEIPEELRMACE